MCAWFCSLLQTTQCYYCPLSHPSYSVVVGNRDKSHHADSAVKVSALCLSALSFYLSHCFSRPSLPTHPSILSPSPLCNFFFEQLALGSEQYSSVSLHRMKLVPLNAETKMFISPQLCFYGANTVACLPNSVIEDSSNIRTKKVSQTLQQPV